MENGIYYFRELLALFYIIKIGGYFMRYGYIRVSTKEQNIDRQLSALQAENISEKQIYIDYASGKDFPKTSSQSKNR